MLVLVGVSRPFFEFDVIVLSVFPILLYTIITYDVNYMFVFVNYVFWVK